MAEQKQTTEASHEQLLYAKILNAGMLLGLVGLIVTFAVYAFAVTEPLVPRDEIPSYWAQSVTHYLENTDFEGGWSWAKSLGKSDMLNFVPIAFLSALTILCYIAILPSLIRRKDTAYVVLAVLEVLVLCLAASGLLGSGGH